MDENIILLDNVDLNSLEIDITDFLKQVSNYEVASSLDNYWDRIFNILKLIYEDENYRHSYYEISNFLENNLSPDERDQLSENILLIYNESHIRANNDSEYEKLSRNLAKLSDHISLEILRIGRMQQIQFIGNKVAEQSRKNKDVMYRYKKKAERLESRISGFHSQSITILGIFSGLVFTFVTSGNLILEAVAAVNEVVLHKLIYVILVVGFIIFNLVYMLMYSISKISGNSMSTECVGKQCLNCGGCQNALSRLKKKYPLVFWFNLIILSFVFAMSAFYILNETSWFQIFLEHIGFNNL